MTMNASLSSWVRSVARIVLLMIGRHYSTACREPVNTPRPLFEKILSRCSSTKQTRARQSLTGSSRRVHNPAFLQRRHDHEAHLSAEQPPPQEDTRIPGPDAHQERSSRSQAP